MKDITIRNLDQNKFWDAIMRMYDRTFPRYGNCTNARIRNGEITVENFRKIIKNIVTIRKI